MKKEKKCILKKGVLKTIAFIDLILFIIIVSCIESLADHIILLFIIISLFTYLFYILKKYNFI